MRERVFAILGEMMPDRANAKKKPAIKPDGSGMEQPKIRVFGVLRLGLNVDYDWIQELGNI